MAYSLKQLHQELDRVAVAISVVGTRRKKLMELARMVVPVADRLVGDRPTVKKVRDDLVRQAHNVRRAPLKARPASKSVRELADKVKEAQKLFQSGRGDVPREFAVRKMTLPNIWGYTPQEVKWFLDDLGGVLDVVDKMGLTREIGRGVVILDPRESPWETLTYDPFADHFVANPSRGRGTVEEIAQAVGGRLWVQLFKRPDVEVWGAGAQGWDRFAVAFSRLVAGRGLNDEERGKMETSLGRVIGPVRLVKLL